MPDDPKPAVTAPETPAKPERLVSLDAYRGFIMLAMVSAGLRIPEVAKHQSGGIFPILAPSLDHVPWQGCAAWDLIQPAFMFMVGVAVPYSLARRMQEGVPFSKLIGQALRRSLILILLAIFLSSPGYHQTNFVFINVLAQIGLGYVFVVLLCGRGLRAQIIVAVAILAGYWLLFLLYPVPQPGPKFPYSAYGLPSDWQLFSGVAAHWNKHTNVASQFDLWFLNLFPRESPYVLKRDDGGYATLNFIPSIATMILGLMAGELLKSSRSPERKCITLLVAGAGLMIGGLVWMWLGCPIVKRIWTPSWVLVSGAFVTWMLALFYAVFDMTGWKRWALPLSVVGMNSIAIYCMSQTMKGWIWSNIELHLGAIFRWAPVAKLFELTLGPGFVQLMPIVQAGSVTVVLWLVSYWMYRQKIFIRI
jgi:predicted acyltransferase